MSPESHKDNGKTVRDGIPLTTLSVNAYSTYEISALVLSERERSLFAVARPSACRLSSVTLVRPSQAVEIFGNISTALGTLAIH